MDDPDYTAYVQARLPELRRSASLLCGDWDRGDDVVQKVLTDLYVRWGRVRRMENPDAYVRTMLFHRFLDERRRVWWTRVRLGGVDPQTAAPTAPDAASRLDVHAALAQIPPRQRAAVVLRYFHDQSIEQVAETLGCRPGTVKSQTARGLAALRAVLTDREALTSEPFRSAV